MSKNRPIPTLHAKKSATESHQSGISGLSSDATARRRMLLKSLGKGSSVIAAAAIPMHTLAATGTLSKTINGTRCTVSSMASGVHSQDPTTETCAGLTTSRFADPKNWPMVSKENGKYTVSCPGITKFDESSTYSSIFGCGSNSKNLKIILNSFSDSDEGVWVTALFNSIIGTSGVTSTGVKNYPYLPAQVILMCKNKPTAVAFFRNNLQNI